jgi:flagellar biosynthesis/type III secretory pathway chaperone
MNAPASGTLQSPLEAALVDVHATLAALLAAADEQHVAVVARDRQRLEGVTNQQERLSTRLERAERKRLELLGERTIAAAVADEPPHVAALVIEIADNVRTLQRKHQQTANLIEQSVKLNAHTIDFLKRLVGAMAPAYGARGAKPTRHSVLLDSRA